MEEKYHDLIRMSMYKLEVGGIVEDAEFFEANHRLALWHKDYIVLWSNCDRFLSSKVGAADHYSITLYCCKSSEYPESRAETPFRYQFLYDLGDGHRFALRKGQVIQKLPLCCGQVDAPLITVTSFAGPDGNATECPRSFHGLAWARCLSARGEIR